MLAMMMMMMMMMRVMMTSIEMHVMARSDSKRVLASIGLCAC